MTGPRLKVFVEPSAAAAAHRAADLIAACVSERAAAVLGLPTGRTPIPVYEILADRQRMNAVELRKVHSFNLDELIGLSEGDPRSYAAYMHRHWVQPIGLTPSQVHVPQVSGDLVAACTAYDDAMAEAGGLDLVLLGIGANGHLAFNEPGTPWHLGTHVSDLAESTRRALVQDFGTLDAVPRQAVTMGMRTILSARLCVLLATGPSKASVIARALQETPSEALPASALRQHPRVSVVLDADAAAQLHA